MQCFGVILDFRPIVTEANIIENIRSEGEMLLAQRWTAWSWNEKRALQFKVQPRFAIGKQHYLTERSKNMLSISLILQVRNSVTISKTK